MCGVLTLNLNEYLSLVINQNVGGILVIYIFCTVMSFAINQLSLKWIAMWAISYKTISLFQLKQLPWVNTYPNAFYKSLKKFPTIEYDLIYLGICIEDAKNVFLCTYFRYCWTWNERDWLRTIEKKDIDAFLIYLWYN